MAEVDCPVCKANGKCKACGGVGKTGYPHGPFGGWDTSRVRHETCPSCQGSGLCQNCGGKGKVWG
jgi:hypothetical protein